MNRETLEADTKTFSLMLDSLKHIIIEKDKVIADQQNQIKDLRFELEMYQLKDQTRPPFDG